MPVIKSANAPTNLAPFSMQDIEQQARAILARAQQQAERLLTEAQIEAGGIRDQALARAIIDGRRDGLAKGMEEGRKAGLERALAEHKNQLTELINALSIASTELNASRKELEAGATGEVVKLAVSIARRVTKKYGQLDPEVMTANISEAMKLVVHATDVHIAVHPSQHKTLTEALPRLKLQWPGLEHVHLIQDEAIAPGGCRISAGQGQIDADLDNQINRIAAELLPAIEGAA